MSKTIASLHETRSVDLSREYRSLQEQIGAEGASALADTLQANNSVTDINLHRN
jgi:hypothetical protein